MKTAKKRRGRPPKHKGERLSKTRSFRIRGEMDEYLSVYAQESGRSVSEEIEARLQRSFYLDGVLAATHGPSAPLVYALSAAVGLVEFKGGDRKHKSRVLQVAAVHIIAALCGLEPTVSEQVRSVEWLISTNYAKIGLAIAGTVLRSIGDPGPIAQFNKTADLLQAEMIARAEGKPVDEALLEEIRLAREESRSTRFQFVTDTAWAKK